MKKIITTIVGFGALAVQAMFSSCNFLDVDHYFKATFKEDSIFHSKINAYGYLWNVAAQFPSVDAIWKNSWFPGQLASDELAIKQRNGAFWGVDFAAGRINEHNLKNWNTWSTCYLIIQRCNKMLANVNGVEDMVDSDRREYRAYTHFLRAWAYYHLLMNWGPLLIVGDEISPTDAPDSHFDRERSTFDESIDYICNEFALSLKGLPKPNDVSSQYFERPNAGVALALIARLRLMQASPTFNGGESARRAFNGWKNSKGEDYINQTYDPSRWAVAAAAAKQVIDLNYYQLHTIPLENNAQFNYLHESVSKEDFPNGAGGIDPYASFAEMFNGETLARVNRELIWAKVNAGHVNDAARHSFPTGDSWGGALPICVPQRVVDCFLMKDGKLPENSELYSQDITEVTDQAELIGSYELKNGVSKQYANRSVRFYASIGFPGRFWPMNSCQLDEGRNKQFWYDNSDNASGKAHLSSQENMNITGYVPVKFVHPDDSHFGKNSNPSRVPKSFPIIRYAEMLLIYCEAMNQVADATVIKVWDRNGEEQEISLSRDIEEMRKYFNMIRYRVGLPGVEDAVLTDVEAFDKLIRNERQVELFNEGHRYWDTRRWGTYITEDTDSKNWTGLDTHKDRSEDSQNKGFWTKIFINEQNYRDRVAHPKMIFLPIHHNELLKTPKMDQNWGWER